MGSRQVGPQFAQDFRLGVRQPEPELRKKWFDQAVIATTLQAAGFGLEILSPGLNPDLQVQELIKCQPLAGHFRISVPLWKVNQPDRLGAT